MIDVSFGVKSTCPRSLGGFTDVHITDVRTLFLAGSPLFLHIIGLYSSGADKKRYSVSTIQPQFCQVLYTKKISWIIDARRIIPFGYGSKRCTHNIKIAGKWMFIFPYLVISVLFAASPYERPIIYFLVQSSLSLVCPGFCLRYEGHLHPITYLPSVCLNMSLSEMWIPHSINQFMCFSCVCVFNIPLYWPLREIQQTHWDTQYPCLALVCHHICLISPVIKSWEWDNPPLNQTTFIYFPMKHAFKQTI